MKKIALIVLALFVVMACKKKKTEDNSTTATVQPPSNNPSNPVTDIFIPADADGVLRSSEIPYEFSNNYVTRLGKATAYFYTSPGNFNYVDAGVVKANDSTLAKLSGAYYFGGKPINGQPKSGINYSGGSTWTVTGTSSVPSFTFSNTSFPTMAALTSGTLISKATAYNLTYSGVVNADSVVVILSGDSTAVQKKTVVTSAGGCVFSSAELGKVKKAGTGNFPYINITTYNMVANPVSSKKYYMINSNTSSYRINIY